MAKTTDISLRNKIIYQVFPRQYSKTHDLMGVDKDLKRIKDMGYDIIQLLPVHPIGVIARKGSIGSPYSIMDYRAINPDYGTMEDLKKLFSDAHALGLKVIMDMVFNHTSKDSILTESHPEWFYHKENGDFANRVGDWSDITDLKFEYPELFEYLSDTLLMYVRMGCDGFRFDVASIIPYEFFAYSFPKLRKENPDILLLAESVHQNFLKYIRDMGYEASSDGELYTLFDAEYEYDTNPYLQDYMKGLCGIKEYLCRVEAQEASYPANYVKARYLENHDFGCANTFLEDDVRLKNLLALSYFCKGIGFLFNGIETASRHLPNLFEVDEINWNDYNKSHMADFIKKMNEIKKHRVFADGVWNYLKKSEDFVILSLKNKEEELYALINLNHEKKEISFDNPGTYRNLLTGKDVEMKDSFSPVEEPVILKKL